jgi:hypothetical protein
MSQVMSDSQLELIDAEEAAVDALLAGARDFSCHDVIVSKTLFERLRAARDEIAVANDGDREWRGSIVERFGRRVY